MNKRLHRRIEVLTHVASNPGIALNKLFIDTSPACQRTGRTRAFGADGWTIPKTLQALHLIECKTDWTKVIDWQRRNQVRHTFYITPTGQRLLDEQFVEVP